MKLLLKKNQIIVTTLAVMIAAAGYLNYSGRVLDEQAMPVSDDSTLLISDDSAQVNTYAEYAYDDIITLDDDGLEEASAQDDSTQIGEAVLANSSAGTATILSAAKLNREQIRAKSREELLEVMNSTTVGEEQKNNAAAAVTELAQTAEKEAAAELLLEAKGFEGCVVSIADGKADVVIHADQLSEAQRAQIEDIVKRKTDISGENIVIIPSSAQEES